MILTAVKDRQNLYGLGLLHNPAPVDRALQCQVPQTGQQIIMRPSPVRCGGDTVQCLQNFVNAAVGMLGSAGAGPRQFPFSFVLGGQRSGQYPVQPRRHDFNRPDHLPAVFWPTGASTRLPKASAPIKGPSTRACIRALSACISVCSASCRCRTRSIPCCATALIEGNAPCSTRSRQIPPGHR